MAAPAPAPAQDQSLPVRDEEAFYFERTTASLAEKTDDEKRIALQQLVINGTKTTTTEACKLHAYMRCLYDVVGAEAAAAWVNTLAQKQSLLRFVGSAYHVSMDCRAMIRRIKDEWPEWDWTIPENREPEFWTERILKPLRYLAVRTKRWQTVVALLAAVIDERVRDGRRGATRENVLTAGDVRRVVERVKHPRDNSDLDLANISTGEPEPAPEPEREEREIEHGRPAEEELADISTMLEQNGLDTTIQSSASQPEHVPEPEPESEPEPEPKRRRGPTKHNPRRDGERLAASLQKEVELKTQELQAARLPVLGSPTYQEDLDRSTQLFVALRAAQQDRDTFSRFFSNSRFGNS
ncbi:hypothetical protein AC578_4228 [Pseudocercospora eumusae]|uniref:Uncharacterized protein n=1 Tax=Pseudocercospora eumusae TaxID=321146 RepID=A0A139H3H1_9PEZI|nr:hypothetical protein AC578_4228 [Pseudocercospora eumusae]